MVIYDNPWLGDKQGSKASEFDEDVRKYTINIGPTIVNPLQLQS
jgi:hypothetical protein